MNHPACLRDLARFDEMMRGNGRINGRQVVPAAVVERIRKGGDPARFAGYATLPGWSYGNQWRSTPVAEYPKVAIQLVATRCGRQGRGSKRGVYAGPVAVLCTS